jgi:cysteine-rich repeat protein
VLVLGCTVFKWVDKFMRRTGILPLLLIVGACLRVPAEESGTSSTSVGGSETGETSEPTTTTVGSCGDGMLDEGEECDDGNEVDEDGCPSGAVGGCKAAVCGDGVVWAGQEACDGGEGCTESCEEKGVCGNGKVEAGEGCDDGNVVDEDGCPSGAGACKALAGCGDGYVWSGQEACDDGNEEDGDGCPSGAGACQALAACGDGYVEGGVEGCDDGNMVDEDGCPSGAGACKALAVCGDGYVEAGVEECDDKNGEDLDECSNKCATPRWVFVTSNTGYNGNLGGIAGADGYCQTLASAASLGGTYKAWLTDSDAKTAPAERFGSEGFVGWYRLRTNPPTGVAEGWADLVGGNRDVPGNYLQAAISVDEKGNDIVDAQAWTNTQPNGSQVGVQENCMGWTTALGSSLGVTGNAKAGIVDSKWTQESSPKCNVGARLYCFQTG